MTTKLTLNLPDETVHLAQSVAATQDTSVENVVTNLLFGTLPLIPSIDPIRSISELSDTDLMALSQITLTAAADKRHLALLDKQQREPLTAAEDKELHWYSQVYGIATLYKTKAMIEATHRGLIAP
jgi:hypothetical protein